MATIETVASEQQLGTSDLHRITGEHAGAGMAVRINGQLYPVAQAVRETTVHGPLVVLDVGEPD